MSSTLVEAKVRSEECTNDHSTTSTRSLPATESRSRTKPSKIRWKFRAADALLITSDGSKIGVNRRKLASYSPFFSAAFFGGYEESRKRVVRLPSLVYARVYECLYVMEKLDASQGRDFTFDISLHKAMQIFETANFLTIDVVCEWLSNRIVNLMTPEELINYYHRVEYQSPTLTNRLHSLIVQNCDRIYQNKTFMQLDEKELIDLLKKPRLNLTPGQEKSMVSEYLEKSTQHDNLALRAIRDETVARADQWGFLGKPRTPNKVLITFGGWSTAGPSNAVEVYDSCANRWMMPDRRLFENPRAYHATLQVNRSFYTIGGFNGSDYFATMRQFDFDKMQWKDGCSMVEKRCYVSACAFDNSQKIAAIGGHNHESRLATAEIYDIAKNEWLQIADMNMIRSDGHALVVNGKVTIVGGFDGSACHGTAEFYDPHKNAWFTYGRPMHSTRSGVSAVNINGAMFVTGGFSGFKRLNSTEFMDPREGNWHLVRTMLNSRSNFAMEEMDGRVFVSGGFDGISTTDACEVYDFRRDAWSPLPNLAIRRSAGYSTVVEYHDIIDALTQPASEFIVPDPARNPQFQQALGMIR